MLLIKAPRTFALNITENIPNLKFENKFNNMDFVFDFFFKKNAIVMLSFKYCKCRKTRTASVQQPL